MSVNQLMKTINSNKNEVDLTALKKLDEDMVSKGWTKSSNFNGIQKGNNIRYTIGLDQGKQTYKFRSGGIVEDIYADRITFKAYEKATDNVIYKGKVWDLWLKNLKEIWFIDADEFEAGDDEKNKIEGKRKAKEDKKNIVQIDKLKTEVKTNFPIALDNVTNYYARDNAQKNKFLTSLKYKKIENGARFVIV